MKFFHRNKAVIQMSLLIAIVFFGLTWSLKKSISEEIYAEFAKVEKVRLAKEKEKEEAIQKEKEEEAKYTEQQIMKGQYSRTYRSDMDIDIVKSLPKCKTVNYSIQITGGNPTEDHATMVTNMIESIDDKGGCMLYFIFRDIPKTELNKKGKL